MAQFGETKRLFRYFPSETVFKQQKLAADYTNASYIDIETGEEVFGDPDVCWQDICFIVKAIEDVANTQGVTPVHKNYIYTHGQYFNCDGIDDAITLEYALENNVHGLADALDVATELTNVEKAISAVLNDHEIRIKALEDEDIISRLEIDEKNIAANTASITALQKISYVGGTNISITQSGSTFTINSDIDTSEFKTVQSAKTDPTASGNSSTFISSITQNANGEITATKANVPDYSTTYAAYNPTGYKVKQTAVDKGTYSAAPTQYVNAIYQNANGDISYTYNNLPDYSNTYQAKGTYITPADLKNASYITYAYAFANYTSYAYIATNYQLKGSYKITQTPVSEGTSESTSVKYVSGIYQNANGEIAYTYNDLPDYSSTYTTYTYLSTYYATKDDLSGAGIQVRRVDTLPETGEAKILYFVPKTTNGTSDVYNEYMWMWTGSTYAFELIGSTQVDLTDYVKKQDLANASYTTYAYVENNYQHKGSYITPTDLKNASYVTYAYVFANYASYAYTLQQYPTYTYVNDNYKIKQTAVSAGTKETASTKYISGIHQDEQGVISYTYNDLPSVPDYKSTYTSYGWVKANFPSYTWANANYTSYGYVFANYTSYAYTIANYKKIQTAVSDPTASGTTTYFIDSISQNTQGVITATKKQVEFPDYSGTYQPLGDYKIIQSPVENPTASGNATSFISYISQDENGEITARAASIDLSDYVTKTFLNNQSYVTSSSLTTTLAGYKTKQDAVSTGTSTTGATNVLVGISQNENGEISYLYQSVSDYDEKVKDTTSTSKGYILAHTSTGTTATAITNTSVYMQSGGIFATGTASALSGFGISTNTNLKDSGYNMWARTDNNNPILGFKAGSQVWYFQATTSYLYLGPTSSNALWTMANGNAGVPGSFTATKGVYTNSVYALTAANQSATKYFATNGTIQDIPDVSTYTTYAYVETYYQHKGSYVTTTDLFNQSYVTKSELSAQSYVQSSTLAGYKTKQDAVSTGTSTSGATKVVVGITQNANGEIAYAYQNISDSDKNVQDTAGTSKSYLLGHTTQNTTTTATTNADVYMDNNKLYAYSLTASLTVNQSVKKTFATNGTFYDEYPVIDLTGNTQTTQDGLIIISDITDEQDVIITSHFDTLIYDGSSYLMAHREGINGQMMSVLSQVFPGCTIDNTYCCLMTQGFVGFGDDCLYTHVFYRTDLKTLCIFNNSVNLHDTFYFSSESSSPQYLLGVTTQTDVDGRVGTTQYNPHLYYDNNTLYANDTAVLTSADLPDYSNTYKAIQTSIDDPTASGNSTTFIDTISQDTQGVITVTKKNVNFPDYSNTYKVIQTAISDPTASGNSTTFISSISQDKQGVITATKASVPDYKSTYTSYAYTLQQYPTYGYVASNYKIQQTTVDKGTYVTAPTKYVNGIYQNEQGVISYTYTNLPDYSNTYQAKGIYITPTDLVNASYVTYAYVFANYTSYAYTAANYQPKGDYQPAGDYKTKQNIVYTGTYASTPTKYVNRIYQDANGVISYTYNNLPDYTSTYTSYTYVSTYYATKDDLAGAGIQVRRVSELPATGESKVLYFVPKQSGSTTYDIYDEYMWMWSGTGTTYKFELVGTTQVNLTDYVTKQYLVDQSYVTSTSLSVTLEDYKTKQSSPVSTGTYSATPTKYINGIYQSQNGDISYTYNDLPADVDKKTSSANDTSKLYLVGAKSQSSDGVATYTYTNVWEQSGQLNSDAISFSNGGLVIKTTSYTVSFTENQVLVLATMIGATITKN